MAGSSPCLMDAIMLTALFVTADANSTSCQVIGRVLDSVGPSVYLYKFIHCTPELNRGDFCVDGVDYNASGSTSLVEEIITFKLYSYHSMKEISLSTN